MKIISGKSIFASLIVFIILSFVINMIFNEIRNSKNPFSNIMPTKNNEEKIFGVKIHKQNKKGEKFLIVAKSLIENNSNDKEIITISSGIWKILY